MALIKTRQLQLSNDVMHYYVKYTADGVGDTVIFAGLQIYKAFQATFNFLTPNPPGSFDIFRRDIGGLAAYRIGLVPRTKISISFNVGSGGQLNVSSVPNQFFITSQPQLMGTGAIEVVFTSASVSVVLVAGTAIR